MKYYGTYNNDTELVPKSYVDSLLYSHIESSVNVAYRVILQKKGEEEYYDWDNYQSSNDVPAGDTNYVDVLINPDRRSTSITFTYNKTEVSDDLDFPQYPSNITSPDTNTIYYVLGLEKNLTVGKDLFIYLKTEVGLGSFNLDTYKIRILIPNSFTFTSTYDVFCNGMLLTNDTTSPTTRNGYVDIGYGAVNNPYYTSATLHIYFDGTTYFIDKFPSTTITSNQQEHN